MEAARAWSVPRSIFLGRPWPQAGEPMWLPEDRWWALALLEAESGICTGCGQVLEESTLRSHEWAYTAEAVPCHGCRAAARRTKAEQGDDQDMAGMHMRVWKKEPPWG